MAMPLNVATFWNYVSKPQGALEVSAQTNVGALAQRIATLEPPAPALRTVGMYYNCPQSSGHEWMKQEVGSRRVEMGYCAEWTVFSQGGREVRKGWAWQKVKGKRQSEGETGLTFRALPESVGFHAEGGAEAFFIV